MRNIFQDNQNGAVAIDSLPREWKDSDVGEYSQAYWQHNSQIPNTNLVIKVWISSICQNTKKGPVCVFFFCLYFFQNCILRWEMANDSYFTFSHVLHLWFKLSHFFKACSGLGGKKKERHLSNTVCIHTPTINNSTFTTAVQDCHGVKSLCFGHIEWAIHVCTILHYSFSTFPILTSLYKYHK